MSQTALMGILVALVVVGGIAWFLLTQRRRTEALKSQYGPEYSRAVREAGSQRAAEQELLKRQERVEQLEIRPLVAEQREGFVQRWRSIQALFVDDPSGAISPHPVKPVSVSSITMVESKPSSAWPRHL